MSEHSTEESFLTDVATHKIEVLLDNGVHRNIRFARPGTNCYSFSLITGPGFLLYRGDMGCFEFERSRDMFEFFRFSEKGLAYHQSQGRNIPIKLRYWAEKLEAVDKDGGVKEFSEEKFRANVKQAVDSYLEWHEEIDADEFRAAIDDEVLNACVDEPGGEVRSMIDFCWEGESIFPDFYEYGNEDYTYHFVWCCYAISWGIMQYDAFKSQQKEAV